MLTLVDIPEYLNTMDEKCKKYAAKIIDEISKQASPIEHGQSRDLTKAYPASVIFIVEGVFRYFHNGKFIRFYSDMDILVTSENQILPVSIISEFCANIYVINRQDFFKQLSINDSLASNWFEYQIEINNIMHTLCSLYSTEEFEVDTRLMTFDEGDTIISEGDLPDCLYEMIEGSASVIFKGVIIGTIKKDEIFGETAFLTQGKCRTATVVALEECMVQSINAHGFEKIVKYRPTLIHQMSKMLAGRLMDADNKIITLTDELSELHKKFNLI